MPLLGLRDKVGGVGLRVKGKPLTLTLKPLNPVMMG